MNRWRLLAWLVFGVLWGLLPWWWWRGGVLTVEPRPHQIRAEAGLAYSVQLEDVVHHVVPRWKHRGEPETFLFVARSDVSGRRNSALEILEDGERLAPAHAEPETIRSLGGGAYSQRKGEVLFSSSDGSDPRHNGRSYVLRRIFEPKTELWPLVVGWGSWLAGVFAWLWLLRRPRAGDASQSPSSPWVDYWFPAVLLVFSLWSFFCASLRSPGPEKTLVVGALASGLILGVRRGGLFFRPFLLFLALLFSLGIVLAEIEITPVAGNEMAWGFAAFALLGWIVASSLRARASRGGPEDRLLPICGGLALLVLLQNVGFDLKTAISSVLPEAVPLPVEKGIWNRKFHETWLIFLLWGSVAASAWGRTRLHGGRLAPVFLLSFLAIVSGYSQTTSAVLVLSVAIFLVARLAPGRVRPLVGLVVVGSFLLAPLLVGAGWQAAVEWRDSIDERRGVGASLAPRLVTWEASRRWAAERPILGWGPGAASRLGGDMTAEDILGPDVPEKLRGLPVLPGGHPHNLQLQVWLETGLLGAVLMATALWLGLRRIDRVGSPGARAALLTLASTVFLVFSLNYPVWRAPVVLLLAVTSGMVLGITSPSASPQVPLRMSRRAHGRPGPRTIAGVASLVVVAVMLRWLWIGQAVGSWEFRRLAAVASDLDSSAEFLDGLGYLVLLEGWTLVAGATPVTARSLSLAAGVATMILVWWLTRRRLGDAPALGAALFLAVSVEHVAVSQKVSAAAVLGVVATIAFGAALAVARSGSPGSWLLLGSTAGLAVLVHPFGLAVAGSVLSFLVVHAVTGRSVRGSGRDLALLRRSQWPAVVVALVLALGVALPGLGVLRTWWSGRSEAAGWTDLFDLVHLPAPSALGHPVAFVFFWSAVGAGTVGLLLLRHPLGRKLLAWLAPLFGGALLLRSGERELFVACVLPVLAVPAGFALSTWSDALLQRLPVRRSPGTRVPCTALVIGALTAALLLPSVVGFYAQRREMRGAWQGPVSLERNGSASAEKSLTRLPPLSRGDDRSPRNPGPPRSEGHATTG